jgi:FKBP-type peptidyl-prolyl cis-trans isomerase
VFPSENDGSGGWDALHKIPESRSGQGRGSLLGFADKLQIMRNPLYKSAVRFSAIAFAATGIAIAQEAAKDAAEIPAAPAAETGNDASYALGYRTGGSFAQEFGRFGVKLEDLEMDTFVNGFKAAVKGGKPELEEARLQAAMTSLGEMLQKREKESAQANIDAGKKFLEENGKREGVTTTPSGLQYEVLVKGGESKYVAPKEGDPEKQFMVNYKGTLIDGTEFDASPEGSQVPMTLQVIEGFKEALTTMPVGAKWKLFIPSNLAYGEERRSAEIAPNTTLIFELELVEIKDAPPAPEGGGFPVPVPQQGE